MLKVINYFDIVALRSISFCTVFQLPFFLKAENGKRANDFFFTADGLIFYDLGYLLYYNSLFGESVILSLLLWFSVLVYLVKNENKAI